MRRLTFGQGSVRIEMDAGLEELARRAVSQVAPGVLERIDAAVDQVLEDAQRRWPVKTGRSRDGLAAYTSIAPAGDRIQGTVMNPVDYAVYVKSRKGGLEGRSAVVELLRKPLRARASQLADELGTTVAESLKR